MPPLGGTPGYGLGCRGPCPPSGIPSLNSQQFDFELTIFLSVSNQGQVTRRTFCSTLLKSDSDPSHKDAQTLKSKGDRLEEQPQRIQNALKSRLPPRLRHENIYTLPNILTVSRLLCAPAIGYLVLHDSYYWATGLFLYAGITDLIDGWIARRWKLQTVVGTVIDPLADKALMMILTVCLAVQGGLPIWLATLILGRDASLGIAAIYYRFASLPPPKTFARYWDFSLPSAEVHPTSISKINTAMQLGLIGATTAMPILGASTISGVAVTEIMTAAQLTIAGTTIWSGLSYLYTHDAVTILGSREEAEKRSILRKGRGVIAFCFATCLGTSLVLDQKL